MGSYSPPPFVDEAVERAIHDAILRRAVQAMAAEGVRYTGVLYAGLVVTEEGPKVLEFNCRMGDPETQALVPRLRSDLGELFLAATEGNLGNYKLHWSPEACVTVVLASGGYPGEYATGVEVRGIADAEELEGVVVFHAGTTQRRGKVVTSGGRVLAVSALGKTVADARALAYEACNRISFEGMHYRRDVALAAAGGGE
jgi:phosphoribosylamine--glycine ligase